jgi:predicted metalloprotease
MDIDKVREIIDFTNAERKLISSFNLPADAFTPLLLSLRDGGDWSYSSENIKTIAVMDKTTIYDDERKLGYSLEEIYLFVNPVLSEEEGTVHRLEKCGDEEMRLLVRRPYKVRVKSDRIIKTTVNPLEKEIKIEELAEKELVFDGSTAYDIAHEIEHLKQKEIKGGSLWEFRFTGRF